MWYVYFLQSKVKKFLYIGYSGNLTKRMTQHAQGKVQSTERFRPLELICYIVLPTQKQAINLEKYFKTGSGRAILKKRILQI